MTRSIPIFLLVILSVANRSIAAEDDSLYTHDGYDNIVGLKAVCWTSHSDAVTNTSRTTAFSSDIAVMPDLITHDTAIMRECPVGTDIHLEPPPRKQNTVLRTGRSHRFELVATVNMTSIRDQFGLTTENALLPIAGRVVFCPPNGNLCSPFIVSQTRAALLGDLAGEGHSGMSHNTDHGSHTDHGGTAGDSGGHGSGSSSNDSSHDSMGGQDGDHEDGDHDEGHTEGDTILNVTDHNGMNSTTDHATDGTHTDGTNTAGDHPPMVNGTDTNHSMGGMNTTHDHSTGDLNSSSHTIGGQGGDLEGHTEEDNIFNVSNSTTHHQHNGMNSTTDHATNGTNTAAHPSMVNGTDTNHPMGGMHTTPDNSTGGSNATTNNFMAGPNTTGTRSGVAGNTNAAGHSKSIQGNSAQYHSPKPGLRRRLVHPEDGKDGEGDSLIDKHTDGEEIVHGYLDLSVLRIVNESSPWKIEHVAEDEDGIVIVSMVFDIFIEEPGAYLPLGVLQILVEDNVWTDHGSSAFVRIDVANLIHASKLEFQQPADVRSVASAVRIFSMVAISIAATIQIAFIVLTIKHRNESVMQASQGRFLILLQSAGLVASVCSFLYEPRNNIYCQLKGPLTLIPMQFMLAVIFGRLVRITYLMEDLLEWHKPADRRLSLTSNGSTESGASSQFGEIISRRVTIWWERWCRWKHPKARQLRLRKSFSVKWLWGIIVAVTLPQVITQIVGLVFFPQELTIVLNDNKSMGRYECLSEELPEYPLTNVALIFLTLLATMYQANKSRNLPGLFNEAMSVSLALLTTIALSTLAFTLIIATHHPTSPPDVQYLLIVVIILNFSLNVSVRVVLPKLRLIWKGEKVVVSKLIGNHVAKQSRSLERSGSVVSLEVSTASVMDRRISSNSLASCTDPPITSLRGMAYEEPIIPIEKPTSDCFSSSKLEGFPCEEYTQYDGQLADAPAKTLKTKKVKAITRRRKKSASLVVKDGYEPPEKLTKSVMQLNHAAGTLSRRILSGLVVSKEDWNSFGKQVEAANILLNRMSVENAPDEYDC